MPAELEVRLRQRDRDAKLIGRGESGLKQIRWVDAIEHAQNLARSPAHELASGGEAKRPEGERHGDLARQLAKLVELERGFVIEVAVYKVGGVVVEATSGLSAELASALP